MKKVLLALSVLVFASLACSAASSSSNPTSVPVVPMVPAQNILFQDDFSDPNSGWPVASDADKAVSYSNGQYLMQAITAKQDMWAHPGKKLGDVSITVDATKSNGPDNNDFGIVCRFVDDNNFYFFMVASDGYQAIGKYLDGKFSYLSADKMQPTTAVNAGSTLNKLRADCVGSTLTLYANGQMLSTVTDTSFTTGDVGLLVGTFDEPNVSVQFDNFVVTKP
jgi:hypothetical protein